MAEMFDSSSAQCSFLYSLSASYAAGSVITISNADGNVLEEMKERGFTIVVVNDGSSYKTENVTFSGQLFI